LIWTNKINETQKFATASVYGLKERKAIYREGLGATLISDDFDISKPYETPKRIKTDNTLDFRTEVGSKDTVFTNIDYTRMLLLPMLLIRAVKKGSLR
jgi:hypothetical protein